MDLLLADSSLEVSWHAAWVWAILLLLLGVALAVLEVFIPSGGILSFLAFCSIVAAIVAGFMDGRLWVGFAILGSALFGVPVAVIIALRWWPSTPFGRRMLLGLRSGKEVLPDIPRQQGLKDLIDRVGVAKSKMLPSGAITIDGRTVNAVSEWMPISAGQRVRVVKVQGNRVVVRSVDEGPPSPTDPDPLSHPIDSVGLDPFEDPPG